MKLKVLTEARNEAFEAVVWYDEQVAGLGVGFIDAYEHALEQIEENPYHFSTWPAWKGRLSVRRALLKRFPYALLYVIREDFVLVLATAHLKRRPRYWTSRVNKRWAREGGPKG